MVSSRNALKQVTQNVDESMGVRTLDHRPQFSPVASPQDAGRVPLRKFGQVEVDRIVPDPQQPRTQFDEQQIQRLAGSIRAHGQLHPIRVRWHESLSKWAIVSGERRWRATRAAGLPTIDCYFHEDEVSEAELREQQLVENLLREDLKPLEEARAYTSLMELNGWNGKQVAAALRVTPSRVSRALALLDLPPEVQQKVEAGLLPKTSAYEISKLLGDKARRQLADEVMSGERSHAVTARKVNQRRGRKKSKPRQGLHQAFFAESGLKVTVTANRKANYHEVEQALHEALDEVRLRIKNNIQIL